LSGWYFTLLCGFVNLKKVFVLLTFSVPSGTLGGVESNRSKLLECALQLFASRGYDAVGVQEVAEAAGLKKPTLYHYFGSKSGLMKTLLATYFEELFVVLEKAADYQGDVKMTLTAVCGAYFAFAQKHPSFYRMQLAMWFSPPEGDPFKAVAAINARQQQILETLFLKAAQDHGNMRGRHQAYAATLLGMINTYIALGLNGYASLDAELVTKAVHQFMHGIFS
jgi:TetR/AcrR family transcriptional regulator